MAAYSDETEAALTADCRALRDYARIMDEGSDPEVAL